jgi:hypothetical protein
VDVSVGGSHVNGFNVSVVGSHSSSLGGTVVFVGLVRSMVSGFHGSVGSYMGFVSSLSNIFGMGLGRMSSTFSSGSLGQFIGSISNKARVFLLSGILSTMGITDNLSVVGSSGFHGFTGTS